MKIRLDGKARQVAAGSSIGSLLEELGISRQVAITKVNGRVRPDTFRLKEGDNVEIIKVVFGG